MRMMYYSVMTQANSEKEIPSAPINARVELKTSDYWFECSTTELQETRVEAKAIKLGSCDKHPKYFKDLNVWYRHTHCVKCPYKKRLYFETFVGYLQHHFNFVKVIPSLPILTHLYRINPLYQLKLV